MVKDRDEGMNVETENAFKTENTSSDCRSG